MNSWACARRPPTRPARAWRRASRRRYWRPRCRRTGSCRRRRTRSRSQRRQIDLLDIGAVDHHASLAGVVQAREQAHQAGLAGGGGADQDVMPIPGATSRADPGQGRHRPVVAKCHPLERDPAPALGQGQCARRALHAVGSRSRISKTSGSPTRSRAEPCSTTSPASGPVESIAM